MKPFFKAIIAGTLPAATTVAFAADGPSSAPATQPTTQPAAPPATTPASQPAPPQGPPPATGGFRG